MMRLKGQRNNKLKPSEFTEIIATGEGLHVNSWKPVDRLPNSFFDTVCAFLKTDGGTICLEVGDNGAITGVEPPGPWLG